MKKLFTIFALSIAVLSTQAQNPFIQRVGYRGAFAPAPAAQWTDGWTEWDPNNALYGTPTVTLSGNITTNTTLSASTVYLISGLVYVKNNVTLTIPAGTVLLGDANTANSSLIITKGSKIIAVGTATNPIVFSSSEPAGSRDKGDWGGLIILGKASVNRAGGIGNIEGITVSTDTEYGGGVSPDDNDNSGSLKYVRVEFGGYIFATDNEINGVTFGGVGRNTTVDYVQTSFTNDDSFEWFGGSVNCSHLVAYRGLDDDFDTDFGFSGSVQFGLAVRDPQIADQSSGSTSEGFESDNDGSGSSATPYTSAVFSNITVLGPFRGSTSNTIDAKFRRSVRIRRASRLKVLNSIFTDFPTGVFIDGSAVRANLATGNTVFKNNIVAGSLLATEAGTASTLRDSLFNNAILNNDSIVSSTGILVNPTPSDYVTGLDYRPSTGSPALSDTNFNDAAFSGRLIVLSAANFIKTVSYRGAFAPAPAQPWTNGWTEWDPINATYGAPTVTVSGNITTNTTWTSGNVYLLQGLVYVKNGATLTIQPGTIIRGDANTANSSLIITKGAKINAVGTASSPIVFTSSKAAGSRALADWGGVIILGRASLNRSGGTANIEGIAATTDTEFGGGVTPDDNDNSGSLRYARIEFGGYIFATDNEINGLTLGAVGRGTTIDHIQTSYINDDAFEWFGGSVNASHLVSYRNLDDDFDTDNGFSGSVQFGLVVRDPNIADQSSGSTSEGFESDNDATGTLATPFTSALFSNITVVGPYRGSTANSINAKFRRSVRIRRASQLKVFNSYFADFATGVFLDGSAVTNGIGSGLTRFRNNLLAGNQTGKVTEGVTQTLVNTLFGTSSISKNDSLSSTSGILTTPYNFTAPDYRPASGSPLLSNFDFSDSAFTGKIAPCDAVGTPVISGRSSIYLCVGNETYTATQGYETYSWTVPANATIVSGQGTNTLVVSFTQPAFASGTISVTAGNNCGNTATGSLLVNEAKPATPGSITGPTNSCAYVTDLANYSILPVAGATSYVWTVSTAQTGSFAFQGTAATTLTTSSTSVNLNFTPGYISGAVVVAATNGCYTSANKILTVLKKTPAIPTAITGPADVCTVIGATGGTQAYSIAAVPGAISYTWGVPLGATLVSGQGTTSVVYSFPTTYTSGSVTVKSDAACGSSANKTLVVAKKIPSIPGPITGTTDVCTAIGANSAEAYSINPVTLAEGYEWALSTPNGTIVSGQGTTAISATFVTAYSSGVLSVKATRTCGQSPAKVLVIYKRLASTPAAIAGPLEVCTNVFNDTVASYSIPASTPYPASTGYLWTVPANATLESGQGTQVVTIRYAAAFAAGAVTVAGTRSCGVGIAKVIVPKKAKPATPGAITGDITPGKPATGLVYSTTAVPFATTYNWLVPAGCTIVSGQGTTSITVNFSATAAAGTIKVTASSTCGLSSAQTLAVTPTVGGRMASTGNATIYPNPNDGNFTLNIQTGIAAKANASIQILDVAGRIVSNLNAVNVGGTIYLKVADSKLVSGVYAVKYTVNNVTETLRMVVRK